MNPTPHDLPPHIVRRMDPKTRRSLGLMTAEDAQAAHEARSEADLQALVEGWLSLHGYERLTAQAAIQPRPSARGWFGHSGRSEGQPFMPDIWLFNLPMTRCLMIELKKPTGQPTYRPGQLAMIEAGRWHECRSLDGVRQRVLQWEQENEEGVEK